MSQKTVIVGVKVSGRPFIGHVCPTDADGRRLAGPPAPTWTSNPHWVMDWLCAGWHLRFNDHRAQRCRYQWETGPDGQRRRVVDAGGNPVLMPLGRNPVERSKAQAREQDPHLAAIPDPILESTLRLEDQEWWAAVKRRDSLKKRGRKAGRMPGMRRRHHDAGFVCWHTSGRNATYRRTGRRTGIVTITGQNPPAWRGGYPARWTMQIRVRHTQPVRDYTSVRVNWTRRQLVFVNTPTAVDKRPTGAAAGLDKGIVRTVATSDGDTYTAPDTSDLDVRIKHHSRRMAKSRRINNPTGARNWKPTSRYLHHKRQLARACAAKARRLDDWRHQVTTHLVRVCDFIAIEDLDVKNMTASAAGTVDQPGDNVAAKTGLNRSLATAAFGDLRQKLLYKTRALIEAGHDQHLLAVPPKNTSRRCCTLMGGCGHTAQGNRKSQADFTCTHCDRACNADDNAAGNILEAALSRWVRTDDSVQTVVPPHGGRPAGSRGKTNTSEEVPAHGPDGAGIEPRTTRVAS